MTTQEVKEWLSQVRSVSLLVEARRSDVEHLRSMVYRITPVYSDDVPVKGGDENRREDALARLIDAELAVDREIQNLTNIRREVDGELERLSDPVCKSVMIRRYLTGQTWEAIAEEMNYSKRSVCYLHGKGLQLLSAQMSKQKNHKKR